MTGIWWLQHTSVIALSWKLCQGPAYCRAPKMGVSMSKPQCSPLANSNLCPWHNPWSPTSCRERQNRFSSCLLGTEFGDLLSSLSNLQIRGSGPVAVTSKTILVLRKVVLHVLQGWKQQNCTLATGVIRKDFKHVPKDGICPRPPFIRKNYAATHGNPLKWEHLSVWMGRRRHTCTAQQRLWHGHFSE